MLTKKQYSQILDELDNCNRPLYFFHDDSDGLASFLLLYRYKKEGKGVCVKSHPKVDSRFFKVTQEYAPDKIFILDLAILEQDFVDEFRNIPIIWIDHHSPTIIEGVKYFNPRVENVNDITCVAHHCYNVVREHSPDDIWIAAAGIIGDWQLSTVTEEFSRKFPDLLPASIKRPEVALFDSPFSKVIKILNFILKGATQEVMKCVKILTRIDSPMELLNADTSRAKYIVKRFERIDEMYGKLLAYAVKMVSKSRLLVVMYKENKMSFTGELSNELLYRYPDKVILVAREKSGEMKCSLRTSPGLNLPEVIGKALDGVDGYGGGHEYACGACVKVDDFERFVKQIRESIK
ncbi:DHH family phosphoesterase [Candidatus Woesearchaeota archaeon]|nr:DHH family phosphoesterase [Candidatus Woesearchaeota archaeon]